MECVHDTCSPHLERREREDVYVSEGRWYLLLALLAFAAISDAKSIRPSSCSKYPARVHLGVGSRERLDHGCGAPLIARLPGLKLRGGGDDGLPEYGLKDGGSMLEDDEWDKLPRVEDVRARGREPVYGGEFHMEDPLPHAQEKHRGERTFEGEDITGDGGVLQRVLKAGEGVGGPPADGDVVYVHFRATLDKDGRLFEDSRLSDSQLNGRAFCFTLGNGDVIKAWELAVRGMRKGGVVDIRVEPAYAVSEDGIRFKGLMPYTAINHKCGVKEDEVVRFELELMEFGQGRAISNDGKVRLFEENKGVEGIWRRRPNITACDEVILRYVGSCGGVEFVKSKGFEAVRLGHGLLPTGLELAISSWMGANGTATVKVWGPWAVNTGWRPPPMVVEGDTGAEQCHEYRVELLDWSHYEELYSGELKVKCCGVQDRLWKEENGRVSMYCFGGQIYDDDCDDGDRVALAIEVSQGGRVLSYQPHLEVEVGDGSLPVAVEIALRKLKERQEGIVSVFSNEFLHAGSHLQHGLARPQAILNGTNHESVRFRIIFKDVISLFYDREGRVSLQDKVDAAQRRKEQGNGLFGVGAFRAALYKYAEAFDRIEYEDTEESDEVIDVRSPNCEPIHVPKQVKNALNDLKSAIHLNMAACHQKLDATKAAIACCDEALTIYPNHVKALYKRSLLYLKCGDPDAALADMSKAHKSEPMNDAVVRQLAVIRGRIAEYKAKEKARYSGFFDKL